MGKMTVAGMAVVETEKARRAEKIRTLLSQPFNGSTEQIDALKQHIDEFECNANKRYIYQALAVCGQVWFASMLIGCIIPIPEFVNSLLTVFLAIGVSSFILERFSTYEFHDQLLEMKQLYNWCLKGGKELYDAHVSDNTNTLINPQIQRMIKLMAPICTIEFMIAWPKEIERPEQNSGYFSGVLSLTYSAVTYPFLSHSKLQRPSGDQLLQLSELKTCVETRRLDHDEYTGFKQAIDYFMTKATRTNYKELLWTKLSDLKDMAPMPIATMLPTPKMS